MFRGLDVDGDGIVSEKDLQALLGAQDDYAKVILLDCDADPCVGLQFMDYMRVVCGSETQHF